MIIRFLRIKNYLQMLFNKSSLRFQTSVKLDQRFRRYELHVLSGYGFYYFKNGNQVKNFAMCWTNLIDEIVFHSELLMLKLSSMSSFMKPIHKHNSSKEKIYISNYQAALQSINVLKLAKIHPVEFSKLNLHVLSSLDSIIHMCVNIDERLVKDVELIFQYATDIRLKFLTIIIYYQNGLNDCDLSLHNSATLNKILKQNSNSKNLVGHV